uniref:DUF1080 domain-containing protein n=1 Tax=Steinernema glaseri TaxID=37863 RepID=A0A1I7ZGD7_9BILA
MQRLLLLILFTSTASGYEYERYMTKHPNMVLQSTIDIKISSCDNAGLNGKIEVASGHMDKTDGLIYRLRLPNGQLVSGDGKTGVVLSAIEVASGHMDKTDGLIYRLRLPNGQLVSGDGKTGVVLSANVTTDSRTFKGLDRQCHEQAEINNWDYEVYKNCFIPNIFFIRKVGSVANWKPEEIVVETKFLENGAVQPGGGKVTFGPFEDCEKNWVDGNAPETFISNEMKNDGKLLPSSEGFKLEQHLPKTD